MEGGRGRQSTLLAAIKLQWQLVKEECGHGVDAAGERSAVNMFVSCPNKTGDRRWRRDLWQIYYY